MGSVSAYSGQSNETVIKMTLFFLFHHTIPADSSPLSLPGYLFFSSRVRDGRDLK